MSPAAPQRGTIERPPATSPVRLLGAVIGCKACGFTWQSALGPFSEPVDVKCPQCTARRSINPTAE